MKIECQTIVLTGASGGIGSAIARSLNAAGARLVLVGRSDDKLAALRHALGTDQHLVVSADLGTPGGRQRLHDVCAQALGGDISLLINCLGVNELRMFAEQSEESIEAQVQTNLLTPMLVCHALLPMLQLRKEAGIVNIGSTFGSIGYTGFASYSAAKFGLRGFTEALRREMVDGPVAVSYIAPRATRTALNSASVNAMNEALGTQMDDPALVAREVLRVIRASAGTDRFIGWPEKLFVRLNALLPQLVDNALRKQLPLIRRFAKGSVS